MTSITCHLKMNFAFIRAFSLMALIAVVQWIVYCIYRIYRSKVRNEIFRQLGSLSHLLYICYTIFDTIYISHRPSLIGTKLNSNLLGIDVILQFLSLLTILLVNTNMIKLFYVLDSSIKIFKVRIAEYLFIFWTLGMMIVCIVDAVGNSINIAFPNIVMSDLFKLLSIGLATTMSFYTVSQNVFLISLLREGSMQERERLLTLSKIMFASDMAGIATYLFVTFYITLHSLEYYCLVDIINSCLGIHIALMCIQFEKIIEASLALRTPKRVTFSQNRPKISLSGAVASNPKIVDVIKSTIS
jgi:hypothetical protein